MIYPEKTEPTWVVNDELLARGFELQLGYLNTPVFRNVTDFSYSVGAAWDLEKISLPLFGLVDNDSLLGRLEIRTALPFHQAALFCPVFHAFYLSLRSLGVERRTAADPLWPAAETLMSSLLTYLGRETIYQLAQAGTAEICMLSVPVDGFLHFREDARLRLAVLAARPKESFGCDYVSYLTANATDVERRRQWFTQCLSPLFFEERVLGMDKLQYQQEEKLGIPSTILPWWRFLHWDPFLLRSYKDFEDPVHHGEALLRFMAPAHVEAIYWAQCLVPSLSRKDWLIADGEEVCGAGILTRWSLSNEPLSPLLLDLVLSYIFSRLVYWLEVLGLSTPNDLLARPSEFLAWADEQVFKTSGIFPALVLNLLELQWWLIKQPVWAPLPPLAQPTESLVYLPPCAPPPIPEDPEQPIRYVNEWKQALLDDWQQQLRELDRFGRPVVDKNH